MPPRPADLGKLAREITREQFPSTYSDVSHRPAEPAPVDHLKHGHPITARGKRAHDRLGSWHAVGQVWALLLESAPSGDHAAAVRRGDVPWDVFDDAVEAVAAGRRPARGPVNPEAVA